MKTLVRSNRFALGRIALGLVVTCLISAGFSGCGKATFAGDVNSAPDTSIPVVASATDYYFEIGEDTGGVIAGDINLTNVQFFGLATWPGIASLTFEMRIALTGTADVGAVKVSSVQPASWSTATAVVSTTIPAHSTSFQLASANIKDAAGPIIAQQKFWIIGRIRYTGIDLTNTLALKNLIIHAEGEKNLGHLSPLINLGF